MNDKPTRPSSETRAAERDEAKQPAGAGRDATAEEAELADDHDLGSGVADHEREMNDRGANQQGEGRLP